MKKFHFKILGGIILLLFVTLQAAAQSEGQLQLVAIDTSSFPMVRITMLTADSRSAPISDLQDLTLRENGLPVTDLTFANIPNGVDVTFVLDANLGFLEFDDETERTRNDKVGESITRYANQYMSDEGLDAVSIIVPEDRRQVGRFLLEEETDPAAVAAAIADYEPFWPGPTPLNNMLDMALDKAQENVGNGRYQAILLFTDARRLDEQLSYPLLVTKANDTRTPVYVAILGASVDQAEIENAERLFEPTRAFFVHMPAPAAADPIYEIWQQQSSPPLVSYNSRQRQSGRNQVTLNLGSELASASFEIELAAPEVELLFDQATIRRVGTTADALLQELQPVTQKLEVRINWPDGIPRQINTFQLLVNGQAQLFAEEIQPDEDGVYELTWDMRNQEAETVELAVQVTDELGFQGTSAPVPAEIEVQRPLPPTPTLAPTAVPEAPTAESIPQALAPWLWPAAGALFLLLFVLLILWWLRRRRAAKKLDAEGPDPADSSDASASDPDFSFIEYAELLPVEEKDGPPLRIEGDSMTIGSQGSDMDIVIEDASVGRLHARLKRQGRAYWLFDEGSPEGTYINYDRLGLAPRELTDGDLLQFGTVRFSFRVRKLMEKENE